MMTSSVAAQASYFAAQEEQVVERVEDVQPRLLEGTDMERRLASRVVVGEEVELGSGRDTALDAERGAVCTDKVVEEICAHTQEGCCKSVLKNQISTYDQRPSLTF